MYCNYFLDACRTPRLQAASAMYLVQNASLALSAVASLSAWSVQRGSSSFWLSIVCLMVFGSISSAGALGSTLSVEREWTKALCQTDSKQLAKTNSGISYFYMRRLWVLSMQQLGNFPHILLKLKQGSLVELFLRHRNAEDRFAVLDCLPNSGKVQDAWSLASKFYCSMSWLVHLHVKLTLWS